MTHRAHLMTFLAVLGLAALAQAQTFTTLYNFTGGSDGGTPLSGVIQDPAGNLYGTTAYGGNPICGYDEDYGCGVVYKLDTAGTETVLHSFCSQTDCADGYWPRAPLVRDTAGNIYGTASRGSTTCSYQGQGCGTVFKIDTAGNLTVLYSFTRSDGCLPQQGLVIGKSGTLFGTTALCGSRQGGTIFKIDSAGKFTVLHRFAGGSSDGSTPYYGHLTMDKFGNLYGVTTEGGGTGCYLGLGCGVLYTLSKNGKFRVLHSFAGGTSDGCNPFGSVALDESGNLYGTTQGCGSPGSGTIWEVSNTGEETILYNFTGGSDGGSPQAGVTRDSKGNLYGDSVFGGANNTGALCELSASGTFTVLHSFVPPDATAPVGEVLRTRKGVLFGTASYGGGTSGYGTVWSYVP